MMLIPTTHGAIISQQFVRSQAGLCINSGLEPSFSTWDRFDTYIISPFWWFQLFNDPVIVVGLLILGSNSENSALCMMGCILLTAFSDFPFDCGYLDGIVGATIGSLCCSWWKVLHTLQFDISFCMSLVIPGKIMPCKLFSSMLAHLSGLHEAFSWFLLSYQRVLPCYNP